MVFYVMYCKRLGNTDSTVNVKALVNTRNVNKSSYLEKKRDETKKKF